MFRWSLRLPRRLLLSQSRQRKECNSRLWKRVLRRKKSLRRRRTHNAFSLSTILLYRNQKPAIRRVFDGAKEKNVVYRITHNRNRHMDALIIFSAKYLVYVGALFAAVIAVLLPRAKQKALALYGVIALPATYVVAKVLALMYYDPRPFVVGHFIPLIPHAADNGFPSDHTLLLAAIASVLYPYSKKASWTLWIITLAVGFSRVAAGIHHSIDIIGAIVIALVVCRGVYVFLHPARAVAPGIHS